MLQRRETTATSTPTGSPAAKSAPGGIKSELRGMSFADQEARLDPSKQVGSVASAGAVQKKDQSAPLKQVGPTTIGNTGAGVGSSSTTTSSSSKQVGGETVVTVVADTTKKEATYDKAKGTTYTTSSSTSTENKDGSTDTSKGTSLNYNAGALTAGTSASNTKKDAKGEVTQEDKKNTSVGVSAKGLTTSSGSSSKNKDGGSSQSNSTTVGPGGFSQTNTNGSTDKDGTTNTKGTTFGVQDGKLNGKSTNNTEAKDGTQKGTSLEGSIGDGQAKGKIGASGGQRDKHSVNAAAEGEVSITATIVSKGPPAIVEWTKTVALGGEAGAKVGGEAKNTGGKIGAKGYRVVKGTKRFPDEKAAQKFVDNKTVSVLGIEEVDDAADAMTLAVGETQTKTIGGGMSAGLSGTSGGIDVGVGGGVTVDSEVKVEHIDKDTFHVTRTHKTDANGNVSLGTLGISVGGTAGTATTVDVTLAFDVSKEEGKKSLTAYIKKGSSAGPCKLVRQSKMDVSKSGSSVSIGGLDVGTSSETSHGSEQDASGKTTKETWAGKRSTSWGMSLLGMNHKDSNGLAITEQDTNGDGKKERYYGVSTTTEGTGGATNQKALAAATGATMNGKNAAKASGKWTITSSFTQDEIDAFCESVVARRGNYLVSGAGAFLDQITALRDKLLVAKSFADRSKALTEFVSKTGADGIHAIKKSSGADNRDDLLLEGDKYLTGAAGRLALSEKAASLSAQVDSLAADTAAVAQAAQETIGYLEDKLLALADAKRYQDLPRGLRAQEIERTKAHLAEFKGIHARALGEVAASTGGKAGGSAQSKKLDQLTTTLATWEAELDIAKDAAEEWHSAARKSRWVHLDGPYLQGGERHGSAFEALSGKEASAYAKADALFSEARANLSRGAGQESIAREHRLLMSKANNNPDAAIAAGETVIADLKEATIAFDRANKQFSDSDEVYRAIAKRWRGKDGYRTYFNGYEHDLPKGE